MDYLGPDRPSKPDLRFAHLSDRELKELILNKEWTKPAHERGAAVRELERRTQDQARIVARVRESHQGSGGPGRSDGAGIREPRRPRPSRDADAVQIKPERDDA